MDSPSFRAPGWAVSVAVLLLACLIGMLCTSGRQQSQTFDEADHIFAGYRYWKCADFGANPEHPPLVKLVASLPLLFQKLVLPVPSCDYKNPSTHQDFLDGRAFLYGNEAASILFETRLFAAIFTMTLGALIFLSSYRMFGAGAALIALGIFVFEPNILAHGFLVTTDMGVACCLFAAVMAFYFYLEEKSWWWLVLTGVLTGMTLAAKHSGLLVIPVLVAVAVADAAWGQSIAAERPTVRSRALRMSGILSLIWLIAYVTLWGFYGFRFAARPSGSAFDAAAITIGGAPRVLKVLFSGLLRWHVLPESYLYGLKHVLSVVHEGGPTFIFGKAYSTGQWFYFPAVILVKSTLGFLVLLVLAITTLGRVKIVNRRALLFLGIPALVILGSTMPAGLNIGIRHILPIFPFLIMIVAVGACQFTRYRFGTYIVGALLTLHAASSLASYPNYIPYSNEAFGGTRNTYRVLGESNVDWGQSLIAIRNYVRKNDIKDCWVAYVTSGDANYYQTGCKLLPTAYGWESRDDMTGPRVDGTLLIGTNDAAGFGAVNPYQQFRNLQPTDNVAGTVVVYRGHYQLSQAFALAQLNRARELSEEGRMDEAIEMARNSVATAPGEFLPHAQLSHLLAVTHRKEEAQKEYDKAAVLGGKAIAEYERHRLVDLAKEIQETN